MCVPCLGTREFSSQGFDAVPRGMTPLGWTLLSALPLGVQCVAIRIERDSVERNRGMDLDSDRLGDESSLPSASLISAGLSSSVGQVSALVSGESTSNRVSDEEDDDRPVRNGKLRDILDEEFSRCYRFEGVSDFIHDVKHLFRRVVGKDGEQDGLEDLESSLPPHD